MSAGPARPAPAVPAGANSLAALASPPSRRSMLGMLAMAPTALALPVIATAAAASELESLINQHEAAERVFNNAPDADEGSPEELRYLSTLHALDAYVPRTPHEFVRSFSARFSNDLPPNDDDMEDLVSIARHLASEDR
jgi:hypothetical protein